jgi:hypothetical protein
MKEVCKYECSAILILLVQWKFRIMFMYENV